MNRASLNRLFEASGIKERKGEFSSVLIINNFHYISLYICLADV